MTVSPADEATKRRFLRHTLATLAVERKSRFDMRPTVLRRGENYAGEHRSW